MVTSSHKLNIADKNLDTIPELTINVRLLSEARVHQSQGLGKSVPVSLSVALAPKAICGLGTEIARF